MDLLAVETFEDKEDDGDEVGGKVAADGEGDDGVEGDAGTNVDEADECDGDAGEGDGAKRDGEAFFHLCPASLS